MKFPYITRLKYCQKLDFEADPINTFKPLIKKLVCSISKSIKFPYITRLKKAKNWISKRTLLIKTLNKKTSLFDFKINQISLYNAIKESQKLDFEADPINKIKPP